MLLKTQVSRVLLLMVSVNLITSGAQKIYLVTVKSQETDSNYSASVRTQHSGRAKTAIVTTVMVMELSGDMESGAGAVNNIVTIRLIIIMIMKQGVLVVIWLSVKTRVIRYLTNTHSAT